MVVLQSDIILIWFRKTGP